MGSQGCALDVKKSTARFEAAWIVEASRDEQNKLRKSGCLRENSAAALGTKSTAERIAAVGAALAATNKSTLLLRTALNNSKSRTA
jgi:hypothetical protein